MCDIIGMEVKNGTTTTPYPTGATCIQHIETRLLAYDYLHDDSLWPSPCLEDQQFSPKARSISALFFFQKFERKTSLGIVLIIQV